MVKKRRVHMARSVNRQRNKPCFFCQQKQEPDYKDVQGLSRFLSERGKILSRAKTTVCQKHQKRLAMAIKRARVLALVPFIVKAR